MKRRSRRPLHEIYCDILEAVHGRGSSNVTRISYSANLPVDRTKKAVLLLVDNGLLREEIVGRTREYRMTERGYQLLHALRTVRRYLSAG